MKYYYNGKLVRTSKNNYKYAIIWGKSVKSCHTRYDLAKKEYEKWVQIRYRNIEANKIYLEELKKGKKDILLKECGITREQEIEFTIKTIEYQTQNEIKLIELEKKY